jgi:hypothetical protein
MSMRAGEGILRETDEWPVGVCIIFVLHGTVLELHFHGWGIHHESKTITSAYGAWSKQ